MDQTTFVAVNRENVIELARLQIRDSEKHLITANAYWLAQAGFVDESETFGLYSEGSAAGLISLIDPRLCDDDADEPHFQEHCIYVWRLMVDKEHRKKGVGSAAIDFAMQTAKAKGLKGVSLTTMDGASHNALEFYKQLGFSPTGRRLDGEIELICLHA